MRISRSLLLAAVLSAGAFSQASANTLQVFDFVGMADEFWDNSAALNQNTGKKFEGMWDQAVAYHETGSINVLDDWWDGSINGAGGSGGALTVKASSVGGTSTVPTPVGSDHAFLDAARGSGPAGLGVCSTGIFSGATDLSRCSSNFGNAGGSGPSNAGDDNVATPEILELLFNTTVRLDLGAITNANHQPANGTVDISTDAGATWMVVDVENGLFMDAIDLVSNQFWFRPDSGEGYIAGVIAEAVPPVPLPAGLVLMLSGIGMLGASRRLRKKT